MAYRFWIIAMLAACYAGLLYRWWNARHAGGADRWSTPRFPFITLLLIVALAAFEARWQIREHQANTAIVDVSAGGTIRCQRWTEANFFASAHSGYVEYGPDGVPEKEGMITWDTCRDLFTWMESDKSSPTIEQVVAVHVLSHEAQHMAGITSEALAECAAIVDDPDVAQALGATKEQGDALAARYLTEVFPRLRAEYRGDCASELPIGQPPAPATP